jgi:hypothetical protein
MNMSQQQPKNINGTLPAAVRLNDPLSQWRTLPESAGRGDNRKWNYANTTYEDIKMYYTALGRFPDITDHNSICTCLQNILLSYDDSAFLLLQQIYLLIAEKGVPARTCVSMVMLCQSKRSMYWQYRPNIVTFLLKKHAADMNIVELATVAIQSCNRNIILEVLNTHFTDPAVWYVWFDQWSASMTARTFSGDMDRIILSADCWNFFDRHSNGNGQNKLVDCDLLHCILRILAKRESLFCLARRYLVLRLIGIYKEAAIFIKTSMFAWLLIQRLNQVDIGTNFWE